MSHTKLTKITLKGFIGTSCVTCKRKFENQQDVEDNLVWVGYGKVKCKTCYEASKR